MNTPLSVMIENARLKMRSAVNEVIKESSLPAYLIEGILVDVLSDIKSQHMAELVHDFSVMQEEKEGDTDGKH